MPLSPSGSGSRDFTGWDNQQTPEWTFNLNDNLEFRSSLDANFKDNVLLPTLWIAVTNNLRPRFLVWALNEDTWRWAMTGNNLIDKKVMTYGAGLTLTRASVYPLGGLHAR